MRKRLLRLWDSLPSTAVISHVEKLLSALLGQEPAKAWRVYPKKCARQDNAPDCALHMIHRLRCILLGHLEEELHFSRSSDTVDCAAMRREMRMVIDALLQAS